MGLWLTKASQNEVVKMRYSNCPLGIIRYFRISFKGLYFLTIKLSWFKGSTSRLFPKFLPQKNSDKCLPRNLPP